MPPPLLGKMCISSFKIRFSIFDPPPCLIPIQSNWPSVFLFILIFDCLLKNKTIVCFYVYEKWKMTQLFVCCGEFQRINIILILYLWNLNTNIKITGKESSGIRPVKPPRLDICIDNFYDHLLCIEGEFLQLWINNLFTLT